MRRAALLLLLLGCGREDRFKAPETGGSLILFDCGDEVFDWKGEGNALLSSEDLAKWASGVWIGEQLAERALRRLQRGQEGPLVAVERFDVPPGRDVALAQDGFRLRFRAEAAGEEEWSLDYGFAWDGLPKAEKRLTMPARSRLAFVKETGPKRYRLLLLLVSTLTP